MNDVDVLVVGAGALGLACAARLAEAGHGVLVAERERLVGSHTSSRNSEVIHAGLYYPPGSLKADLCLEGRERLYAWCARHGVGHRRIGKLLVAVEENEREKLQALAANVPTIAYWDRSIWPMTDEALARLDLLAEAGIWQPSAEAAAAKVREVWDNPARWWLDERVQSARRAFCREHAFVDPKGPDAHIVSLLQRL